MRSPVPPRVRRALAVLTVSVLLGGCSPSATSSAAPAPRTPAAARAVTLPPSAGVLDYQLGGSYAPVRAVRIVDRDRTSSPVHGRYSICYVNAFQTQPEDAAYWRRYHPSLLLRVKGALVQDPGWPGEYLLDTSTATSRAALARIVGAWIDGCARKGFQAVEADNLDSWTRRGAGAVLTEADNLAFASLLIGRAHADGLAIAQKNAADLSRTGHRLCFDFAVAEECEVYRECGAYTSVYGTHVLEIEYTDNGRAAFARACAARHGRMSIILRDRDVVPRGAEGYVYRSC